jgi:DNA-binding NtrC family response regulator
MKLSKQITSVQKRTIKTLQEYPWPGNVRELESVLKRAMILCSGPVLQLPDKLRILSSSVSSAIRTLEEVERNQIHKNPFGNPMAHRWGKRAAAILGLHPNTLRAMMQKLKIFLPEAKEPD